MNGEAPNTKNEAPQATDWDSLAGYDAIQQNLQDKFLNIEDMLSSGRITEEQADKFRQEVTARAEDEKQLQDYLGQKEQAPEEDFAGERNFNDQTGKERTFSEWDLYPRQKGETSAEYGERLQRMHELTAEADAEAEAAEDAAASVKAARGAHARVEATPIEEAAELDKLSRAQHANLDDLDRLRLEDEERAKLEDEERAKLLEEEQAKLDQAQHVKQPAEVDPSPKSLEEAEALQRKIVEKRQAIIAERLKREEAFSERIKQKLTRIKEARGLPPDDTPEDTPDDPFGEDLLDPDAPLVAINADFTHDKQELAHDYAEQALNKELAASGTIKKIWKGNLFKKYYEKKYEREFLSGERTITDDGDDLNDVISDRSGSAIRRFVLGATTEYDSLIHEDAGESLTEADTRTTEVVKSAIEWFASAEIPEGGSMADLTREFGNRIGRLQAEGRDQDQPVDETLINNYYEVALQARQRAEHGMAMDRVMDGFKVYNADVRDNVRSEAHRDNLDKIINSIESSKIGQVVPAEIVAGVVGTALAITQTGAKAAAGVVGAIGISGAAQGLRARNRITEDRARMMRDVAAGYEYDDPKRSISKHEARIGGTLYDTRSANDLIQNLSDASKSEDSDDLFRAIAEARIRIEYSDSESKDLISYSSADRIGDERLQLDLALIRAEHGLSDREREDVAFMKGLIARDIVEDIEEKDASFRKLRLAESLKASGIGAAISTSGYFISQEAIAAIDPAKVGLFEKVGLLKTDSTNATSETLLAGLAGGSDSHPGALPQLRTLEDIEADRTIEIDRYKEMGFQQVETKPSWSETTQSVVSVEPAASDHQVRVAYDGWANNGTTVSDGNELGVSLRGGQFVSELSGSSTMGGESFDYGQLAEAGRIKGYITVGDAKFEVASTLSDSGQLSWGENGTFTTTTGETIKAIGDNGERLYQYFEVALDNGVDADGATHIIPFATEVGDNTFSGTIDQITEVTTEHPATYDFVRWEWPTAEAPLDTTYDGVIIPGVTARAGLGVARNPEASTPAAPTFEPIPAPQPAASTEPPVDSAAETIPLEPAPEASAPATEPASPTEPIPTPEAAPQPATAFREQINSQFGDLIGDEGVDFMASQERINRDGFLRIANWWNSLPDEAKDAVISYEQSPEQPEYGGALRTWLQTQNLLSYGPATPEELPQAA